NDLRFTESIPFKEGHYPYVSRRSLSVYFRKVSKKYLIHVEDKNYSRVRLLLLCWFNDKLSGNSKL
uniref:Ovule protein n=1 Tax=Parascaris univalens TaxID=6257 RepID=A0A915C486_PARUN